MKYKDAGVDVEANNESNERIKKHVRSTFNSSVVGDIGMFGGAMSLKHVQQYKDPVLVLSADGVGTKVVLAELLDQWESIGHDIVNHSANDILTSGATPLFFLDYIASEKLEPAVVERIVAGMAAACRKLNIVLIGGETAEMPGVYQKGRHDVAGVIGGVVEKEEMINTAAISEGDALIGIASSGLHTNGYSLARAVVKEAKLDLQQLYGMEESLGRMLLQPHREYVTLIRQLRKDFTIKGIAHITGGGITDNLPRILPKGLGANIRMQSWPRPRLFALLQEKGSIPEDDMRRAFNLGIGLIIAVAAADSDAVLERINQGDKGYAIGTVVRGKGVAYAED